LAHALPQRLKRIPGQLRGRCPFGGTLLVERLPLVATGLVTARNFRTPLGILDHVFRDDGDLKYLDVPGFPPFLFVRAPEVIRKITILATYHMNRCERHWGVEATGYPATAFVPDRWDAKNMEARGRSSKDNLHFGFGHGPRVCIGKHFSEAEAFVCVTLFLRRFKFRAVYPTTEADSGVSTRPRDQVDVELSLRFV
jgi:hypothetical protein